MTPEQLRRKPGTRAPLGALVVAAALLFAGCESGQIATPVTTGVQWTRITDPSAVPFVLYPDWRGDSILFEYRTTAGARHLGIVASNGSGARSLAGAPTTYHEIAPRWIDDTTFVYSSQLSSTFDLWYRSTSGATARRLTAFPGAEWDPAPQPTGPGLLYVAGLDRLRGRVTLIPDTAATPLDLRFLTADSSAGSVEWDPSGTRVCFSVDSVGASRHIFLINLASVDSLPVQLTTGPFTDQFPHFSPDGARILFSSNRTGRQGLWWVSPSGEGAGLQVIAFANAGTTLFTPRYSPDGSRIVVTLDEPGFGYALWVLSNLP